MKGAIPEDVRRFILLAVPNVPFLEALLLLRTEGTALPAAEMARRLYLPEASVQPLLDALVAAGLGACEAGAYRYAPAPHVRAVIDDVAREYATNLIGVAELIHSRSDRQAARFAEAFRIRKEN